MHMSDALLAPEVGAAFWLASGATIAYASRKVKQHLDQRMVPLMGVLGAFVFAAQMINFTIPGTGSSGHLAGTTLLAILLGPHAAFLTISSVLTVQALLFADGGILALGANMFNLGVLPCYLVYPLLYPRLASSKEGFLQPTPLAAFMVALVSLQLGSLGVVVETTLSGIAELPFVAFVTVMQPIHLAIGGVEGFVTLVVLGFLQKAYPDIHRRDSQEDQRLSRVVGGVLVAAMVTGGVLSWYASENPDGLEWSLAKVTKGKELSTTSNAHQVAGEVQKGVAVLPDYQVPEQENSSRLGTSVAGLLGGLVTLLMAASLGWLLRRRKG
ncbi:MAG: cobalamin biosynthesis protein CbiM [Magnetococcales bacterium]|nr:cobalamin biosynthesis protein CbiM [Magnetococcales bacterium]